MYETVEHIRRCSIIRIIHLLLHDEQHFAIRTLRGRSDPVRDFAAIGTCETLTVDARRHRISIALDGEVLKLATPLKFSIRPGALTVFVPA